MELPGNELGERFIVDEIVYKGGFGGSNGDEGRAEITAMLSGFISRKGIELDKGSKGETRCGFLIVSKCAWRNGGSKKDMPQVPGI